MSDYWIVTVSLDELYERDPAEVEIDGPCKHCGCYDKGDECGCGCHEVGGVVKRRDELHGTGNAYTGVVN